MSTEANGIATENEAYAKGNYTTKRMYDGPVDKKLVTKDRLKYLGCIIYSSENNYESNQCVKYEDIISDYGAYQKDDSWIWYYQLQPSMIYDWSNAYQQGASNWDSFIDEIDTLSCLGAYLVPGYNGGTLSYAPMDDVNSFDEPFDLHTGDMDGGLRLLKMRIGSTDTGYFIAGHGGYANTDGRFFTNLISGNSSVGYTKSTHQINIRYSDGQMSSNNTSDSFVFIFRFCLQRVPAGNGWNTEYTTVGIGVNDMKVSKLTYADYRSQLQQGRITDLCTPSSIFDYGTPSAFPYSPSEL